MLENVNLVLKLGDRVEIFVVVRNLVLNLYGHFAGLGIFCLVREDAEPEGDFVLLGLDDLAYFFTDDGLRADLTLRLDQPEQRKRRGDRSWIDFNQ